MINFNQFLSLKNFIQEQQVAAPQQLPQAQPVVQNPPQQAVPNQQPAQQQQQQNPDTANVWKSLGPLYQSIQAIKDPNLKAQFTKLYAPFAQSISAIIKKPAQPPQQPAR